jgi:hypothetical protein
MSGQTNNKKIASIIQRKAPKQVHKSFSFQYSESPRTTMKFLHFVSILYCASMASCDQSASIALAMGQIVNKVAASQLKGFQVLVYGNQTRKKRFEKVVKYLGKSIDFPLIWDTHKNSENVTYIDRSAIMFYTSWDDYHKSLYFTQLKTQHQSDLYFLTYVDEQRRMDPYLGTFRSRFTSSPRFFHEYFLEVNRTAIILSTFEIFQQPECRDAIKVEVNEFSIPNLKWKSEKFSLEKFIDMNQCEIVVDAISPQNLALQFTFRGDRSTHIVTGYVTKFNDIISKKLNFTFMYNPTYIVQYFNESVISFKYGRANITLPSDLRYQTSSFRKVSLEGSNGTAFTVTKGYTKVDEIILISRFKPYTILEKVFLPFEPEVWYWLLGSMLLISLISLVVLKFASKAVRKFVFGSRVTSPYLNMM